MYLKIREKAVVWFPLKGVWIVTGAIAALLAMVWIQPYAWDVIKHMFLDEVPDCYQNYHSGNDVCNGTETHWIGGLFSAFTLVALTLGLVAWATDSLSRARLYFMRRAPAHKEVVAHLSDTAGRAKRRSVELASLRNESAALQSKQARLQTQLIELSASHERNISGLPEELTAELQRAFDDRKSTLSASLEIVVARQAAIAAREEALIDQTFEVQRLEKLTELAVQIAKYEECADQEVRAVLLPHLDQLIAEFVQAYP